MNEDLPKLVLSEVAWDFYNQQTYLCPEQFEQAVEAYQLEYENGEPGESPVWVYNAVVLRCPMFILKYYADPSDEPSGFHEVEIESNEPTGFRARELLFKIHNAVINRLATSGHRWYEGLELVSASNARVPKYLMIGGS